MIPHDLVDAGDKLGCAARIGPAHADVDNLSSFGNLTLLTRQLNPAVSNSAWERKREGILEHSALALNRRFQTADRWDEEAIEQRAHELFAIACRVWPRPDGQ